jgi:hypothetical protein
MQDQLGPTEFWDGAMAAVVTRKTKVIKVVEQATFTTLTMQFPATPATTGAANPNALTYPAQAEIRDVASFRLATGSIQAIYAQGEPSA